MIQSQSENSDASNNQYSETEEEVCRTSIEILHTEEAPQQEPTVELRQKLMEGDEVYLYKIPPLQTSGGHRYVY